MWQTTLKTRNSQNIKATHRHAQVVKLNDDTHLAVGITASVRETFRVPMSFSLQPVRNVIYIYKTTKSSDHRHRT